MSAEAGTPAPRTPMNTEPTRVPAGSVLPRVADPVAVEARTEVELYAVKLRNRWAKAGSTYGLLSQPTPGQSNYDRHSGPKLSELSQDQFEQIANRGRAPGRPIVASLSDPVFIEHIDNLWMSLARTEAYYESGKRSLIQSDDNAAREWGHWLDTHERLHASPGYKGSHEKAHGKLSLPQPGRETRPGHFQNVAWGETSAHIHKEDGSVEWIWVPTPKTTEETHTDVLAQLLARVAALEAGKKEVA
jgi:hypothetical protein